MYIMIRGPIFIFRLRTPKSQVRHYTKPNSHLAHKPESYIELYTRKIYTPPHCTFLPKTNRKLTTDSTPKAYLPTPIYKP